MEWPVILTIGILLAIAAGLPAWAMRMHLAGRLREEHRDHAARLKRLLLDAPDAVFTVDEKGTVRSFNKASERLFGYQAQDVVGRHISMLIPAASGGGASTYGMNSLHAARKTPQGIGVEVSGQRQDGVYLMLDLQLTEIEGSRPRLFQAVARDVSGRKEAERLAGEAQFLAGLLESVGAPVLVLDREGKVVRHNRAFLELSGYRDKEPLGRHYWELLLEPEEWAASKASVPQVIAGNTSLKGESRWRLKSGESAPVCAVMAAIEAGNAPAEHAVVAAMRLPEAPGVESGGAATMEALERLAGGLAQQLNDLLTPITGYSELLLNSLQEQDPARRDVEQIKKAGDRAAALASQLLVFGRKQPMRARVFHLNDLINQIKPMLAVLLGERIQLSTILDLDLGPVRADPGWMEQVILNLAVNARDAMASGGRLSLETAAVTLDAGEARRIAHLEAAEYVVLTATDTGSGIDARARAHLFEPFYTTKQAAKGLGLGLSTVYGVARQCGGSVVVESAPDGGTSVRVYLPRSSEQEEAEKPNRGLFLVRGAGAG
ncbi:MAG: PAS domain S-box protein [Acidobacteria bacterium]|nr:PAS domain S-box protein [Acidobacteriota bacterium]